MGPAEYSVTLNLPEDGGRASPQNIHRILHFIRQWMKSKGSPIGITN